MYELLHCNRIVRRYTTILTFDVCNFYPSITKELLLKAIEFAKEHTTITQDEVDVIVEAKSTLLFHTSGTYQKKTSDTSPFDITMGSYDGAETCELIGTYILNKIQDIIPKENIGLYRDDGMCVIHKPPRETENIKKKLSAKFKELGLEITATANQKVVDFLDVNLNLETKEHRPFKKPGDKQMYVHDQSNHPPIVRKRIPQGIESRLSSISSNQAIFDEVKSEYECALKEAGHNVTLRYRQNSTSNGKKKRQRKRKITWYNPPYSRNVNTNIGEKFLSLVRKHFPKNHPLEKICNRNTIKLSYSCMPNMDKIIKSHNNSILNKRTKTPDRCNCQDPTQCPMPGRCTIRSIVYQATLKTDDGNEQTYTGMTSNMFKTRYGSHKEIFTNRNKATTTALAKRFWQLKDESRDCTTSWSVLKQALTYTPATKRCYLYQWEKFYIITVTKSARLNQRSDFYLLCGASGSVLLSLLRP